MRLMTLHAYVGAAEHTGGRTRMGVVFADAQGRTLRKMGRTLPGATSTSLAVFRGIVCALWNSRRLGARRREFQSAQTIDRKSTRLNSSHVKISYAVFC